MRTGKLPGDVFEARRMTVRNEAVSDPRGVTSYSLSKHVLIPAQAAKGDDARVAELIDSYVQCLNRTLARCGRREGDKSTVWVGATGGVRTCLTNGELADDLVARFKAALSESLGGGGPAGPDGLGGGSPGGPSPGGPGGPGGAVRFAVLSGEEEARCELRAADMLCRPLFDRMQKDVVNLMSGGGSTCQFSFTERGQRR